MSTVMPELTCQEMVELVTDYLEGALSPGDTARFEAHLRSCSGCREYLAQIRLSMRAAGAPRPEALPPELMERLAAAFRGWKSGS